MYHTLNHNDRQHINSVLNKLDIRQKIGQVLCIRTGNQTPEQVAAIVEEHHVGGIFYAYRSVEDTAAITAAVQAVSAVPVIATADLVNGPGSRLENATLFPWQMALGAADSEELAENMGIATAREGRAAGVHWTFGPIVDLSLNMLNSMMHTRTFGSKPEHVLRLGKAFIRGVQKEGLMAATPKHFPGDGTDDRDSHICTLINDLSEQEWFDSYGRIWQGVIEAGAMCIMGGFIALPWLDPRPDHYAGPLPAALSKRIQIELLRERLGFKGVVISDALPMIGLAAMTPREERVPRIIESGSDMALWADPVADTGNMLKALDSGLLTEAQLDTAVRNILALKFRLGLMENRVYELPENALTLHARWADEIAERSITVIRDARKILPLALRTGAKVLTITISHDNDSRGFIKNLNIVDEEMKARGFEVIHLERPEQAEVEAAMVGCDAVFMNVHILPRYGSTRFNAGAVGALWDAVWIDHPRVIFTSFGDPYKLYEMPYVPTYINTYSNTPSSQRAVVKVWLGEIAAKGRIPVSCPGLFEVEVE